MPEEKIVKVRAGDDVGRFEAGFDFGYATPLRIGYGIKMDAEARYNMVGTPWDFGLQFAILGVNSPRWGVELNSNAMVSGHVDYNWRLWNNIAPYVGLGVGYYDGTYVFAVSNGVYFMGGSKTNDGVSNEDTDTTQLDLEKSVDLLPIKGALCGYTQETGALMWKKKTAT